MDQDQFELRADGIGRPRLHCSGCGVMSPDRGSVRLTEVNKWAAAHQCGPALPPDTWLKAAAVLHDNLAAGYDQGTALPGVGPLSQALAAALVAIWPDLRKAAADEGDQG